MNVSLRAKCVAGFVPMVCGKAQGGAWHYVVIIFDRSIRGSTRLSTILYASLFSAAQGRPGAFGFTCMPLCNFSVLHAHSGPRVPAGTRSSLRPRVGKRVARSGKARAKQAARSRRRAKRRTRCQAGGRIVSAGQEPTRFVSYPQQTRRPRRSVAFRYSILVGLAVTVPSMMPAAVMIVEAYVRTVIAVAVITGVAAYIDAKAGCIAMVGAPIASVAAAARA